MTGDAASPVESLGAFVDELRADLDEKYRVRELGLQVGREVIRSSANAIRAVHRGEFDAAGALLETAAASLANARTRMEGHGDIRFAGFLQDAEKEFSEASLTLAIVSGRELPSARTLKVGSAPYLNGLGETVGELRREVMDLLRRGEVARSETLLQAMDDIYGWLVTIDYPDAMTGGLRRTTDSVRGILERTRSDLTMALRQQRLEEKLDRFERALDPGQA